MVHNLELPFTLICYYRREGRCRPLLTPSQYKEVLDNLPCLKTPRKVWQTKKLLKVHFSLKITEQNEQVSIHADRFPLQLWFLSIPFYSPSQYFHLSCTISSLLTLISLFSLVPSPHLLLDYMESVNFNPVSQICSLIPGYRIWVN